MEDVRRILVLAADIKYSRKAVHYGASLARSCGAELVILHVVHDPFGAEGWNLPFLSLDEEYKNVLRKAKEDLAKVIRAETEKGLAVTEMIREGEPTGVILQVIKEKRIDLLLVPAHEEGRLEHFLFGRSNEDLIRRMPCSILLVRQKLEP
ncbi:MAG: universal stress protein [Candidatus Deferrimicrobiaceae bacterium]